MSCKAAQGWGSTCTMQTRDGFQHTPFAQPDVRRARDPGHTLGCDALSPGAALDDLSLSHQLQCVDDY